MSARVKHVGDGRVAVRVLHDSPKPWLAMSSPDDAGTYLDIESFSDEDVEAWPEYQPPRLGELVDDRNAGTVPTGYYDERDTWLWQTQGGVAR